MKDIEKSKSVRAGLQEGFRDGTSKTAQRRCYGYDTGQDGELVINPDEAAVVRWIFEHYLSGDGLGKIAPGLEEQGIPSSTGKPRWNRETLNISRKLMPLVMNAWISLFRLWRGRRV